MNLPFEKKFSFDFQKFQNGVPGLEPSKDPTLPFAKDLRKVSENARNDQMKKYESETLPALYKKAVHYVKDSAKVGNNSFVFAVADAKSLIPVPASTDNIHCEKVHNMFKRKFTKKGYDVGPIDNTFCKFKISWDKPTRNPKPVDEFSERLKNGFYG